MGQQRKPGPTRESAAAQEMRDQEVLRANRELAAYFKARRTEREARAALKIIKAFVRDRERRDVGSRPPLPGATRAVGAPGAPGALTASRAHVAKTPKAISKRKVASRQPVSDELRSPKSDEPTPE